MNYLPVDFMVNGKTHILWLWKGDYWNLHSGAEIGLYKLSDNASTIDSNTTHYDAIDYEVGMTLSLYNYNGENDIDNISIGHQINVSGGLLDLVDKIQNT
jgi:hypothetical protein